MPQERHACAIAPAHGRRCHCLGPSRCWVGGNEASDESMRPSARAPIGRLRGGGGGRGLGEGQGRLLQQRQVTRAGAGARHHLVLTRRAILGAVSSYCCTRARPALGAPSASDEEAVLEARLAQALEPGGVAGARLGPAQAASVEAIARALEELGGGSLLRECIPLGVPWERHSSPPLPPMLTLTRVGARLALGGSLPRGILQPAPWHPIPVASCSLPCCILPCGATVPLGAQARLEAELPRGARPAALTLDTRCGVWSLAHQVAASCPRPAGAVHGSCRS